MYIDTYTYIFLDFLAEYNQKLSLSLLWEPQYQTIRFYGDQFMMSHKYPAWLDAYIGYVYNGCNKQRWEYRTG